VPLARIYRFPHPPRPRNGTVRGDPLVSRSEPALAARRRNDQRRRVRRRLVRRPETPGVFHSTEPAWNDQNLRELAGHISSPLSFTHIRAAIGSAGQQTNCHPFRHDRWLFMHNGYINEFAAIKRDLILAVDPSLYPEIQGQPDTEVLFFLALTLWLQDDPRPRSSKPSGS
jgi:Glutamine amidotransferase domain